MDEPLVETELADSGPQRRSGPWKLIAIVAVVTVIGVWLVPGDAPDDEPAMTPRAPGIISRDEPGPDTARSLLPGLPEDTQPSAPPAEPVPAVDDRPGAKARAMIASLRTTGDIKLDGVFAAAEQAQSIGELADAYLLYFFAAREGYAPAALALGKQADPASREPDSSVFEEPDLYQAHKWYQVAADNGSEEARTRLADLRTRIEKLAAGGDPQAQRISLLWQ